MLRLFYSVGFFDGYIGYVNDLRVVIVLGFGEGLERLKVREEVGFEDMYERIGSFERILYIVVIIYINNGLELRNIYIRELRVII